MRVKFEAKDYGIQKLIYGQRYFIGYAGTSMAEEFLFTRKNRIEMCEYEDNKKISSYWISKKQLKKILHSDFVLWVCEMNEEKINTDDVKEILK